MGTLEGKGLITLFKVVLNIISIWNHYFQILATKISSNFNTGK